MAYQTAKDAKSIRGSSRKSSSRGFTIPSTRRMIVLLSIKLWIYGKCFHHVFIMNTGSDSVRWRWSCSHFHVIWKDPFWVVAADGPHASTCIKRRAFRMQLYLAWSNAFLTSKVRIAQYFFTPVVQLLPAMAFLAMIMTFSISSTVNRALRMLY